MKNKNKKLRRENNEIMEEENKNGNAFILIKVSCVFIIKRVWFHYECY